MGCCPAIVQEHFVLARFKESSDDKRARLAANRILGGVAVHAATIAMIPAGRAAATALVSFSVLIVLIVGYRRSGGLI